MTGEIINTAYAGRFAAGSSALTDAIDLLDTKGATASADIVSIVLLSVGVSGELVDVYTFERTA